MTSIHLIVTPMTSYPVRGWMLNYGVRETGCMWLLQQRHMCALHNRQVPVANISPSNQVPSFTKISVSYIPRFSVSFGDLTDMIKLIWQRSLGSRIYPEESQDRRRASRISSILRGNLRIGDASKRHGGGIDGGLYKA